MQKDNTRYFPNYSLIVSFLQGPGSGVEDHQERGQVQGGSQAGGQCAGEVAGKGPTGEAVSQKTFFLVIW